MSQPVELKGAIELEKILESLAPRVSRRVTKAGMSKAGGRLRTAMRRDAPRGPSGRLKKTIGLKRYRKIPKIKIGLYGKTPGDGKQAGKYDGIRYYYKTLDYDSARGAALNPWFHASAERHGDGARQIVVNETIKAVYVEAGKSYAKSKRSIR